MPRAVILLSGPLLQQESRIRYTPERPIKKDIARENLFSLLTLKCGRCKISKHTLKEVNKCTKICFLHVTGTSCKLQQHYQHWEPREVQVLQEPGHTIPAGATWVQRYPPAPPHLWFDQNHTKNKKRIRTSPPDMQRSLRSLRRHPRKTRALGPGVR